MRELPLDYDSATLTTETFHFNSDGGFIIETTQNIAPILEENLLARNDARGDWKGGMIRVASIPHTMLPELAKLGLMDMGSRILDQKKFKKFLNDPAVVKLRTKLGKI